MLDSQFSELYSLHFWPNILDPPQREAQRILSRLEFCHTQKHGIWLNMAEIELSVLGRQCLDRRIADMETLKPEVAAWQEDRNHEETWIDWRFTTADARMKLHCLYPSIEN